MIHIICICLLSPVFNQIYPSSDFARSSVERMRTIRKVVFSPVHTIVAEAMPQTNAPSTYTCHDVSPVYTKLPSIEQMETLVFSEISQRSFGPSPGDHRPHDHHQPAYTCRSDKCNTSNHSLHPAIRDLAICDLVTAHGECPVMECPGGRKNLFRTANPKSNHNIFIPTQIYAIRCSNCIKTNISTSIEC